MCPWLEDFHKSKLVLVITEIQPVHPKGNQSWTDVEAETPILWPPDAKNWLIWKDPDAGKDWRQKKKGMTEDEMAGWHHWLNGRESEWTLGVGDGLGSLACCSPWGCKESDMTEQLNWTEQQVSAVVGVRIRSDLLSSLRVNFTSAILFHRFLLIIKVR